MSRNIKGTAISKAERIFVRLSERFKLILRGTPSFVNKGALEFVVEILLIYRWLKLGYIVALI